MSLEEIFRLRQPCRNRGITLTVLADSSVRLGDKIFWNSKEAEEYLMTVPRIDI